MDLIRSCILVLHSYFVFPSDPPTIWTTKPTVYGVQGHSVQLNCTFNGLPVPTITWTSPNGRILVFQSNSINNSTYITIPSLVLEDSGTYTCSGDNSIGVSSASIHLTVQGTLSAYATQLLHVQSLTVMIVDCNHYYCLSPCNVSIAIFNSCSAPLHDLTPFCKLFPYK